LEWNHVEFLDLNLDLNTTLAQKVVEMMKYVSRRYGEQYDFFVKADTDSFVFVENLRGFVQYYNPQVKHYLGRVELHMWHRIDLVFNGGAGYILSKAAMRILGQEIGKALPGEIEGWTEGEDTLTAHFLKKAGILPENTFDHQNRVRFSISTLKQTQTVKRKEEDWEFMFQPRAIGTIDPCCSPGMIVVHEYKALDNETNREIEELIGLGSVRAKIDVPPPPRFFDYAMDLLTFPVDPQTRRNLNLKHIAP